MTERTRLGHEFNAYYDNAGGWGSETWVLAKARQVTPNASREKVEVTRRGSGNMQYAPGLEDDDLEIVMPYRKDGDDTLETGLGVFEAAYQGKTVVLIGLTDGAIATAGTRLKKGQYTIFERSQPQEINGQAFVTYKLAPADTANSITYSTISA